MALLSQSRISLNWIAKMYENKKILFNFFCIFIATLIYKIYESNIIAGLSIFIGSRFYLELKFVMCTFVTLIIKYL